MDDKESSETPDATLENMKVVELKKKLKALGLPLTGNKSELVERLQEAMLSGKGMESSEDADFTLLPDDSPQDILEDKLLEVSSPEKENKISVDPTDPTEKPEPLIVTLKKRVFAPTSTETVKGHKKIVINRNNFPTPQYVIVAPKEPATRDEIKCKLEEKETEEAKMDKDLPHGVIRLTALETKNLTDKEKITLRAKRFNITSSEQTIPKPSKPVKSFGRKQSKQSASTLANSNVAPNMELLKKRAERFGESVSTIMKQLEDHEKVLKRKSKFTDGKVKDEVSVAADPEKIKKRAERFGL